MQYRAQQRGLRHLRGHRQAEGLAGVLGVSEESLQQRMYLKLIEEYEPDIESLAANMATMGLLEPICVRPAEEKGKFDLIFGCRRCLAWMYNFAKSAGKIPARITAEVVEADGKLSLVIALGEHARGPVAH